MNRGIVVLALVAIAVSTAALTVALHRPPAPINPFGYVCQQAFRDAASGATYQTFYPCSRQFPVKP